MPPTRRTAPAATRSRSRSGGDRRRPAERGGVRPGLDALAARRFAALRGKRVGLICNPTAVTSRLVHAADLLHAGARREAGAAARPRARGPRRRAVHGGGGERAPDPRTGVAGDTRSTARPPTRSGPPPRPWRASTCWCFDVQDVGARYYTYQATMLLCMEAAAAARVGFVVLDRPNPLGGVRVEGPALRPGFESFCGLHDLAVRHGMTVGELARLFRAERRLEVELAVVAVRGVAARNGFARDRAALGASRRPTCRPRDGAGLPGDVPARGDQPLRGARDDSALRAHGGTLAGRRAGWRRSSARERLPGVRFRPVSFVPTWDKHAGTRCHGVELFVLDAARFRPFRTGLACVLHARGRPRGASPGGPSPTSSSRGCSPSISSCGSDRERLGIEGGATLSDLVRALPPEERAFERRRRAFLLYDE